MTPEEIEDRFKSMSYKELDTLLEAVQAHLGKHEASNPESKTNFMSMLKEVRDRLYRAEKHQVELLQHISRYTVEPQLPPNACGYVCDQEIGYLREILVNLSRRGLVVEHRGVKCGGRHWEVIVPLT